MFLSDEYCVTVYELARSFEIILGEVYGSGPRGMNSPSSPSTTELKTNGLNEAGWWVEDRVRRAG